MASLIPNKLRKEFTFIWRVENYSCCWHKTGDELVSPIFVADLLQKTSWTLGVFPGGDEDELFVSCYLQREINDEGPPNLPINFEIACLAADGSTLALYKAGKNERVFEGGTGYGAAQFLSRSDVLVEKRKSFLPQDILTLSCRMWIFDENAGEVAQCFARTRIQVESISFVHTIENFSGLKTDEKQTVNVQSCGETRSLISVGILPTSGSCCEEKIVLEFVPGDRELVDIFTCRIHLLNAAGYKVKCGHKDTRFSLVRKDVLSVPLIFPRKKLLERKDEFLPDDSLTLICECSFSIGVEFEKIEKTAYGLHTFTTTVAQERFTDADMTDYPNASDDFRYLLNDQTLSDITLKTRTKSFPAHKTVLVARSPVFKDLLTRDVKDADDCIELEDLDEETLHLLLSFMYTDTVENLHWEISCKLYYAAHKYQIQRLKAMCTSFLLSCLDTANASHLLNLAHIHQDSDLKSSVEDYILENEEEVFGSLPWEGLMESNSDLAMKTMHLKFKRKR